MARIIWSPRALADYLAILNYLQKEWGNKVPTAFTLRIDHVLNLVVNNPRLFPVSGKRKSVRRCVISKQISLYYRQNKSTIEVIALIDNRSDPGRRNF